MNNTFHEALHAFLLAAVNGFVIARLKIVKTISHETMWRISISDVTGAIHWAPRSNPYESIRTIAVCMHIFTCLNFAPEKWKSLARITNIKLGTVQVGYRF
jgi:hypothetical protein